MILLVLIACMGSSSALSAQSAPAASMTVPESTSTDSSATAPRQGPLESTEDMSASLLKAASGQRSGVPSISPDRPITLAEAERLALRSNPRISGSNLLAVAAGQVTRQTRSAALPNVTASLTSEKAEDGSRIGAGSLGSSRLYTHMGGGISLTQLITDFGRTHELIATDRLRQQGEDQTALATRLDVLLETDEAFYRLLNAQALLGIAKATVKASLDFQALVQDRARNASANDLEKSIAAVDVLQAQLLIADTQNSVDSARAVFAEVINGTQNTSYVAVEDIHASLPPPPEQGSFDNLDAEAQSLRPDLQAILLNARAYGALERAQELQRRPTISALAVGGVTPVAPNGIFVPKWYAAGGVNITMPLFEGFKIHSQAQEARFEEHAESKQAQALSNAITRDVRIAILNARGAFKRIGLTEQLSAAALQQLAILQARFTSGSGAIEELRQAHIQSIQADISVVNARYDYLITLRRLDYACGNMAPE